MPNYKSPHIVMTGGGSAGHVTLHLAIYKEMLGRGWRLSYIGSSGIEKDMIVPTGIPYRSIRAGKLRRYFSLKNFFDVFNVFVGFLQSFFYLLMDRPQLVLSKGGFVSVPVCVAAKILGIRVITHESDLTPGLATKIRPALPGCIALTLCFDILF